MSINSFVKPKEATYTPEPPIAKFLFADTRMAWLWLIVRLYVGYQWITAGLDKLTGYSFSFDGSFGQKVSSPWVFGAHDGAAIKGFVAGALAQTGGAHPAVQGWYASFLQSAARANAALVSYLLTFGALLLGLGLTFAVLASIP